MIDDDTVLHPMMMMIGTVSPAACRNPRPKVKYINCYPLVRHHSPPHQSSQSVPISQNSVRRPFGHGHLSTPLRPISGNRRFFHINLHRTNFYFSSAYHVVPISSRHGVDFSSTPRPYRMQIPNDTAFDRRGRNGRMYHDDAQRCHKIL